MTIPTAQAPGVYHRRVGDVLVTALLDGYLNMSLEGFPDISMEDARALLARESRADPPRVSVNVFALRWPHRTVLVDCGSQHMMGPIGGWLPENLRHAGIAPEEVSSVLLTHVHPDHSAGLTDAETGDRLFPNAEIVVHENEIGHWFDDAAMAKADERQQERFFREGRRQIGPYMKDRMRLFSHECEVAPGVIAIPSIGHTPGHTAYMIASRGESMIIWGDTVHIPEIQIAHPDVGVVFDVDRPAAAKSRARLLDRCVADRLLIAGMHVHFPGLAHLRREHGRFELTAEQWAMTV
jgi:glyoxylase-like metal-dependent hydrolase (beta-lactamase superfamily II)